MMTRVQEHLDAIRSSGKKALIPFLCGGFPSVGEMRDSILATDRTLQECGGPGVIEIGIPFSDPIADGAVIAQAMHRALSAGVTPAEIFQAVYKIRREVDSALVAMVSVSIVLKRGPRRFIEEAREAGFDGFIFPDIAAEDCDELLNLATGAGLSTSLLVAPTTESKRAEEIARRSSGFVYVITRMGITGEGLPTGGGTALAERVQALRGVTRLPIAGGFGISDAAGVRESVWQGGADAAIVGSAIVRRMTTASERGESAAAAAARAIAELAAGLRS